jgi:hypothetical protein
MLGFPGGPPRNLSNWDKVGIDTQSSPTVGMWRRREHLLRARITSPNIQTHWDEIGTRTRLAGSVYWRSRRSASTWSYRQRVTHVEEEEENIFFLFPSEAVSRAGVLATGPS